MGDYVTTTAIADFLQISNFSGSTPVTNTQVESVIEEMESFFDEETGHAWRSVTVSNEYHNLDLEYEHGTGVPVFLKRRAVKTLATGSGDKLEVWDGSSWNDWLTDASKSEGRNADYWLNSEKGVLYLYHRTYYPASVRVTYRYGETSIPKDVRNALKKLVAIDLLTNEDRSTFLPEGSSNLKFSEKIDRWQKDVDRIIQRRQEFKLASS